ncbi:lysine histidine transporter-like 7 [Quercus lobata]|uniref:Amino acid transporter transmembrane domain-containing protein n=1 Tax=Quercus lobata TaxID=97700 RepID=A0A7N2N0Q6_QUELO|nr:lysine histidine transporter-like 7 [Quercus lobata]
MVEQDYRQVMALPPSSPNAIFPAELLQTITIIDSDPSKSTKSTNFQGCQPNPQEDWLPITESRNGSTFSATFHLLCSGIGLQALLLPIAFASLGWAWAIICLSLAFVWQLYTIIILVGLHESVSGIRYSRYLQLAKVSFGSKLGKFLAKFPLMYTSGGTCILLIINGGGILDLLFKTICENEATCHVKPLSSTERFLVFTCMAILIAQLPNLNSMVKVSLIGATTAVGYCTLILVLSITKGRPTSISYDQSDAVKSNMKKFSDMLNALAIIALAFRGHNVILEIQGTLPSDQNQTSYKPMCKAVTISYIVIAMSQFPLAIVGFWAYGNKVPFNGGLLSAYSQIHGANTSKLMMGLIYLLVLVNRLCTFQVYAMPVFDNMEMRYITKKKKPCSKWVRTCLRILFGGLTFLAAVALPFFGSLTLLLGGIALPLTFAYPCFMWITMKKPQPNRVVWSINLVLGCLGIVFSVLIVIAAAWTLSDKGLKADFFKP